MKARISDWRGFWPDWELGPWWEFFTPPKAAKRLAKISRKALAKAQSTLKARSREAAENVGAFVDKGKEQVSAFVDKSKEQVGDYVDRGREVVDRGRAQWEEFVERGKNLVADQGGRVSAAVDAGRQAYQSATSEPETHEY